MSISESDLIFKLNDLRELPSETEVFELKEAKNTFDFNKIGKYFSALANEANLKGKNDTKPNWILEINEF